MHSLALAQIARFGVAMATMAQRVGNAESDSLGALGPPQLQVVLKN